MQRALLWGQFPEQLCKHLSLSLVPVFASEPLIEGRGWKVIVCLHSAHLVSLVAIEICKLHCGYVKVTAKESSHWILELNAFNYRL